VQSFGASFYVPRPFIAPPQAKEFENLLHDIFESYPVVALSTTLAHMGALPVLIQENDLLILDLFVHNSVRMAANSVNNKVTVKTVPHNDMKHLERIIRKAKVDPNINNIWYLADGIYSISGAHCPVHEIVQLLDRYDNFLCLYR